MIGARADEFGGVEVGDSLARDDDHDGDGPKSRSWQAGETPFNGQIGRCAGSKRFSLPPAFTLHSRFGSR